MIAIILVPMPGAQPAMKSCERKGASGTKGPSRLLILSCCVAAATIGPEILTFHSSLNSDSA
jgi:hypothetical protein